MKHYRDDLRGVASALCAEAGYRVSLADPGSLDAQMLADWDEMACDAAQPNPFFAPWFLRPAMDWLDRKKAVRLLLLHSNEGALVGLMPVTCSATYAQLPLRHLSVWKNNHLYVGTPLIRRGRETGAMQTLVDWIEGAPSGMRFLNLTQLSAEGPVYDALNAALAKRNSETIIRRRRARAVLRQGHDFETLLNETHAPKKRSELRRRFRRFDEEGQVSLTEAIVTPADAPLLTEAFLRLENDGWKKASPEGFALAKADADAAFFREIIRCGAEGRHILATVLARDEEPVAIGFTLKSGNALFGFKTAFDRQHGRASPGVRIFHETTRRMLADSSVAIYDSCAMPDHPIVDTFWPNRLDGVDMDIPARGALTIQVMRAARRMAATKDLLSAALSPAPDPSRPRSKA